MYPTTYISITHEVYKVFDCNPSQKPLICCRIRAYYALFKRNGISGNSLKLIENFLSDRYQRDVLNGQSSK